MFLWLVVDAEKFPGNVHRTCILGGVLRPEGLRGRLPPPFFIIILSPLEDDPTIVDAVRDLRARNFDVTVLSPSSLEFEFDARRLDRTGYEVLKTERDILMSELRGLGAFVMDWEPDMMLNTALAGARGF